MTAKTVKATATAVTVQAGVASTTEAAFAEGATPVVIVGVPVVDMVGYVETFPGPDGHSPGSSLSVMPGGPAVNVATAAARLGHGAALLGKVGRDALGDLVRRQLAADGVGLPPAFAVEGRITATVLVLYDKDGEGYMRSFSFRQGTADTLLRAADVVQGPGGDAIAGSRAVFIDGILSFEEQLTRAGEAAAAAARRAGARVFCDPNLRVPGTEVPPDMGERVRRLVAASDEVLLSEAEAAMLLACWGDDARSRGDVRAKGAGLRRLFPKVQRWIVKQGAAGATVFAQDAVLDVPPFRVAVSDTSGAGDSFAGAWICAYLEGLDETASGTKAAAAAALTVSGKGAWASLPTRDKLERFLKDGGTL